MLYRPVGSCPYCYVRFKSAGALANYLKAKHGNKTLLYKPMKRKINSSSIISNDDQQISDESDAQDNTTLNLDLDLTSGFCESDVQPESDSDQVELMPYETIISSDVAETSSVEVKRFHPIWRQGNKLPYTIFLNSTLLVVFTFSGMLWIISSPGISILHIFL